MISDTGAPSTFHPLVSICCISFNHEEYIADALNGFLEQKTDFDYEIVVHDDASTDSTLSILEEFKGNHPNKIRIISQRENIYSKGNSPLLAIRPYLRGDYIAFCEGDDFWVNSQKLQKQITALEANQNVDICACQSVLRKYDPEGNFEDHDEAFEPKIYSLSSVLEKSSVRLRTASLVIRRHAFDEYLLIRDELLEKDLDDRYIHFFGAKKGGLIYIASPMVVYRLRRPGSWSEQRTAQKDILEKARVKISDFNHLDKATQFLYHSSCQAVIYQSMWYVAASRHIKISKKINFLLCDPYLKGLCRKLKLVVIALAVQIHLR